MRWPCGQLLWWFRDRIGHATNLPLELIALDSKLMAELGRDSLDHFELILEMEEEFDVPIPDEVAPAIKTVADAIRYIVAHRRVA
jgi:acyl carrier protein